MARVLIVGDSERRLTLAAALLDAGHAVRVVATQMAWPRARAAMPNEAQQPSRLDPSRAPQRGSGDGIEWFAGDPERLGTLRAAFEQVAVACWLFGDHACNDHPGTALHGTLLEGFIRQITDSSVRGLVYEVPADAAVPGGERAGAALAGAMTARNSIPLALIVAAPADEADWLAQGIGAVATVLGLDG